jgi:hypothetical protein
MPRPLFAPGKNPVPIVQEAGWAPGPVWTGAETLAPTGIRSLDRPARSQSLYRLRYPAHCEDRMNCKLIIMQFNISTSAVSNCPDDPLLHGSHWPKILPILTLAPHTDSRSSPFQSPSIRTAPLSPPVIFCGGYTLC